MALKLKPSFETTIDITEDGYVEIRQPREMGEEDDVILLTRSQIDAVAAELLRLKENNENWPDDSPI